jgi:hypothetical protein
MTMRPADLETVRPGDGGIAVVPGSHKAVFSRPRALFWPYSNHGDDGMFGSDRGDGWSSHGQPRCCRLDAPHCVPCGQSRMKYNYGASIIMTALATARLEGTGRLGLAEAAVGHGRR